MSSHVIRNEPHEALEVPPIYFLLQNCPFLLRAVNTFYRLRWSLTYPLQRRFNFSVNIFRKPKRYSFTYGELLLILPFLALLVLGIITSFLNPDVNLSGRLARFPLAIAIVTASHNSIVTFTLGMPFERCIFYHKLAGRLAFVIGIFHTYVAYVHPNAGATHSPPIISTNKEQGNIFKFLFANEMNKSGTGVFLFIMAIILTSLPAIRRKVFEVFHLLHILFVIGMVCCAFFHSGSIIVILACTFYGGDLLIRKVLMAFILYPRKANLKQLTDTVLELSFPKTKNINYNPGQYMFLAVPQLSLFEWHPFSISSSPHQDVVTFHIRVCGNWTRQLMRLAQKESSLDILLEGPYGALGVDLISKDRYKMVMLVSGGIGVTPMQSICNQLMYEHTEGKRELKRVWFLWTARDPDVLEQMEVTRRHSLESTVKRIFPRRDSSSSIVSQLSVPDGTTDHPCRTASAENVPVNPSVPTRSKSLMVGTIANLLLTEFAPDNGTSEDDWADCFSVSDTTIEDKHSDTNRNVSQNLFFFGGWTSKVKTWFLSTTPLDDSASSNIVAPDGTLPKSERNSSTSHDSDIDMELGTPRSECMNSTCHDPLPSDISFYSCEEVTMSPSEVEATLDNVSSIARTIEASGNRSNTDVTSSTDATIITDVTIHRIEEQPDTTTNPNHTNDEDILRLELFLTGKAAMQSHQESSLAPFLSTGRPNLDQSFLKMREEAIQQGEKRIAVCVCAPKRIVQLCKSACVQYSDTSVRFDFHSETF